MPQPIHLIGSVRFNDAAGAIATLGTKLRRHAPRIPDGETDRPWVAWLSPILDGHPAFEVDAAHVPGRTNVGTHLRYKLRPGADTIRLRFEVLRHAAVAAGSYAEFKRHRERGAVPRSAKLLEIHIEVSDLP
jgi:hypothetical protein